MSRSALIFPSSLLRGMGRIYESENYSTDEDEDSCLPVWESLLTGLRNKDSFLVFALIVSNPLETTNTAEMPFLQMELLYKN